MIRGCTCGHPGSGCICPLSNWVDDDLTPSIRERNLKTNQENDMPKGGSKRKKHVFKVGDKVVINGQGLGMYDGTVGFLEEAVSEGYWMLKVQNGRLMKVREDVIKPVPEKPEVPLDQLEDPVEGDWVLIWAQVSDEEHPKPEDIYLNVRSSNADSMIAVLRERIIFPEENPSFAERCGSLNEIDVNHIIRCTRHYDHSGNHGNLKNTWDDSTSYGDMEV